MILKGLCQVWVGALIVQKNTHKNRIALEMTIQFYRIARTMQDIGRVFKLHGFRKKLDRVAPSKTDPSLVKRSHRVRKVAYISGITARPGPGG